MHTFLRKIRRSFIEAGRTRKYILYAIGEIALVVIGILIALQINSWNEYQKERKIEIQYLKEIKIELEISNDELQSDLNSHIRSMNKMIEVRDHILFKRPNNDSIAMSIFISKGDYQAYTKTSSFENLKVLGMNILTNDDLANDIGYNYGAQLTRILDRGDNSPKYDIELLLDPHIKKHLRIDDNSSSSLNTGLPEIKIWTYDWKIHNHKDLLEDDEFLRDLKLGMQLRAHKMRNHRITISSFENTIQKIEEELRRRE